MKLRFEVNQAEAFRRGVEVRRPLVTIQIKVARLTAEQRQLIEERLDGIDVVQLHYDPKTHKAQKTYFVDSSRRGGPRQEPVRIQADLPTFQALMEGIEANEAEVTGTRHQPRVSDVVGNWREPRSKMLHSKRPRTRKPSSKR